MSGHRQSRGKGFGDGSGFGNSGFDSTQNSFFNEGEFGAPGQQGGYDSFGGQPWNPQEGSGGFNGQNQNPQGGFGSFGGQPWNPQGGSGGFNGQNQNPQGGSGSFGGQPWSPQGGSGGFNGQNQNPQGGFGNFGGPNQFTPGRKKNLIPVFCVAALFCVVVFATVFFMLNLRAKDSESVAENPYSSVEEPREPAKTEQSGGKDNDFGKDSSGDDLKDGKDSSGLAGTQKQSETGSRDNKENSGEEKGISKGEEEVSEADAEASEKEKAAQEEKAFTNYGYYYSFLNEKEKKAYRALTESCEKFSETTEVDLDSVDQQIHAIGALEYDHPEFYWVRGPSSYTLDGEGRVYRIKLTVPEDAEETVEKLNAVADSVIEQIPESASEDEYGKIKWFYEYLIQNVDYGKAEGVDDQTITGSLLDHLAVCAGYASAFQFLCDRAGIECIKVHGDSLNPDGTFKETHVWNMVILDGVSYWVDVTWGDPVYEDGDRLPWYEGYCNYDYLCAEDGPILIRHRIDEYPEKEREKTDHLRVTFPACNDDKYCYYKMTDTFFYSAGDAEDYIRRCISEGQKRMAMGFDREEDYSRILDEVLDNGELWDIVSDTGAEFNEMQYFCNDEFYSIVLEMR